MDPRRHECPHELRFDRDQGRQLSFGAGAHYCLGANLAKLVLEVSLDALTQRFPDMALAIDRDEAVWDHQTFAGVVSLPVRLRG
jgi:cytochrome P450